MPACNGQRPLSDPADGLPMPRRAFAVTAISAAIAMTVLDGAMLGVALPGIARDLGIEPATAVWLLNAYQLTVVATLLPLASLGEIMGFRRVFLAGFGVFAVGALGASQADSFASLLACRIAQGLGSSAVMSLTAGLIRHTYPARQLGRAIGINAMVVAVSGAAAPSAAAAILALGPWHWLFVVNLPVALFGILVGARTLPDPPGARRRFDVVGAGLNILTFGLFFLGLDLLLAATPAAIALMAAGLGAGTLLVRRQRVQAAPLLPLDLLRNRVVALSVAASVCAFAAWYASYVALPFLLQGAGRSQVETGLLMTPWPLAIAVAAPLAGRLSDGVPTAVLCAAGVLTMAAGLALLAVLPPKGGIGFEGSGWLIAGVVGLCGAGFGAFQTPNNRTMLAAAPKSRSGGAGGMQATARLLGTTLGTTTLALAFQLAGAGGPRLALLAGVGFALAAAALSLSRRGAS